MSARLVASQEIPTQPWSNGGGRTRELLSWPSTQEWALRVSLADIERDGPFSAFAGVERWFAVVEGDGVELRFADHRRRLTPIDEPLRFDGAAAPHCGLIGGVTRDLNLMHRGGNAAMLSVHDKLAWQAQAAQCGLFTAVAGTWMCADGQHHKLAARTLLWFEHAPAQAQVFEAHPPSPPPVGWWLSFTPALSQPC
jgi:environmental stress-induced protein Ves